MATRIELNALDLHSAIENYIRVQERGSKNAQQPQIAEIYKSAANHFRKALTTITEIK